MLVHRRVTPSIKFAGTHLCTWVVRGTVRVKCLSQEHNTISPARARTQTARSEDERTNHEVMAPPTKRSKYIANFTFFLWLICRKTRLDKHLHRFNVARLKVRLDRDHWFKITRGSSKEPMNPLWSGMLIVLSFIVRFKMFIIQLFSAWGFGFLSVTIISCASLLGAFVVPFMNQSFYKILLLFMVSLAVGVLSGSGFFHLIPHVSVFWTSREWSFYRVTIYFSQTTKGCVCCCDILWTLCDIDGIACDLIYGQI